MADMRRRRRKGLKLLLVCALLALVSAACFGAAAWLGARLDSQQAAQRWQGESDMAFTQLSLFAPVDEKLTLNQIYAFRTDTQKKLHEAALDVDNSLRLTVDAWSCTGKALCSTDLGKGEASVIAVGGDFFRFHPLRLLSGSYLLESDLMKDRVLLDEELAWLLFGGTDLAGLTLRVNGVPFVVSGVIERERDFASRRAYTAGMGLYMSFDAWKELEPNADVTCYELVMAEPVEGFAAGFAREKLPAEKGELVENTGRFSMGRLLMLVTQFGTRSMQKLGVLLPYWENAARCMEDYCALLVFLGWLFAVTPLLVLLAELWKLLRRGKEKLTDDVLPQWRDNTEEFIRVRQRRRWEKRHGKHEA